MDDLRKVLLNIIKKDSFIRLDHFMEMCLIHPEFGYYNRNEPIGKQGTFTTAPEITQMFGELIGLFFGCYWHQRMMDRFTLLELGPGRGTLMDDFLRATSKIGNFNSSCSLVLYEKSSSLILRQTNLLGCYNPVWIKSLDSLPNKPIFIVANEFIDALPIRQFKRGKSYWHEKVIKQSNNQLMYSFLEEAPFEPLENRLMDTREGDIVEFRQDVLGFVEPIAQLIRKNGGLALFIDYGAEQSLGDTFQAIGVNGFADPLKSIGKNDLTAHVDFGALYSVAKKYVNTRLMDQGSFLQNLGINIRSQQLEQTLEGAELEEHRVAYHRLIGPKEMGKLFKVLVLYPYNTPTPDGLT